MKIIVIDDEMAALNTFLLGVVDNDIEYKMFNKDPMSSLEYVKNNKVDAAFLDVNMPAIDGVELAEKLIAVDSRIKIVFITGYAQDREELQKRIGDNLIGFCYKPYNQQLLYELLLKAGEETDADREVFIKTFGQFDVFVDDKAVKFNCQKSKELLALLVESKGGEVSMDYAIAMLWPDKDVGSAKRLYRDAVYKLRKDLKDNRLDIVDFKRAKLELPVNGIKCDYWDYLKERTPLYTGNYMIGYDWSINTQCVLDELYK